MTVATVTLPSGLAVKLGRRIPQQIIDTPTHQIVVRYDGTQRCTVKLGAHWNFAQMQQLIPEIQDWSAKAAPSIKQMYGNDQFGDCVIASFFHELGLWTGNDSDSGGIAIGTTSEAVSQYHAICGPGDNGCDISAVNDYVRSRGMTVGGKSYRIDDYVSVDNTNKDLVRVAVLLFGSLKLGIDLPGAWANSSDGGTWDVTNSGTVGGHDVPVIGYDAQGCWIATWAGKRLITWAAFTSKHYITECYALLSPSWYNADGLSPNGVNVATLKSALTQLGGGTLPPLPGPTPPQGVSIVVNGTISPGVHNLGGLGSLANVAPIPPGTYPIVDAANTDWTT